MADRVKFRSWLYVRIDKPLRAALFDAAQAQGLTVSDLARRELRKALVEAGSQLASAGDHLGEVGRALLDTSVEMHSRQNSVHGDRP